jgi:hypothetical protein
VIRKAAGYQVREYETYILSEVDVTGDLSDAVTKGFRIPAGYIFGNNVKRESIPMTNPVSVATGTGTPTVSFVVPSKYGLDTLPAPVDQRVRFTVVPSHQATVLAFSGYAGMKRVSKETIRFRALLDRDGVDLDSEISLAQYDPPWSPPFLRKNELIGTFKQKE